MAIASGAKNPSTITSTKLRKHVATVAQLLNFNEGDVEQLANFMGHSKEVHKTFYRLPESVFQVAKVSKFLLMMEKGNAEQYRGKNLDDININVEGLISDESDGNETDISCLEGENTESNSSQETTLSKLIEQKMSKTSTSEPNQNFVTKQQVRKKDLQNEATKAQVQKKEKKLIRLPWTDQQKLITTTHFQRHILLKIPPKKNNVKNSLMRIRLS